MSARYAVPVYDRVGLYRETACKSFHEALLVYAAERIAYPDKAVRVENQDRIDLGCADGLTDEERDAVDDSDITKETTQ